MIVTKTTRRRIDNYEPPKGEPIIVVFHKKLDNGELVDPWLPYNTVREREIFEEGIAFAKATNKK